MRISPIWLLFILSISPALTFGDVYKWTDEEGKVHYGDKPSTDSPIEVIDVENAPVYDKDLQQRLEKQKKLLDEYEEEREKKRNQRDTKKEIRREHVKKNEEIREEQKY